MLLSCLILPLSFWTTHIVLSLFARFLFSHTPTQNPLRTLESGHHHTHAFVCLSEQSPILTPACTCPKHSPSALCYTVTQCLNICIHHSYLQMNRSKWFSFKEYSMHNLTHLRGSPPSYGGMMTTLTVTDVLRRSIICSWVSVTAATLQISTNRLPCLSPACQAKPYSSTCMRKPQTKCSNNPVMYSQDCS